MRSRLNISISHYGRIRFFSVKMAEAWVFPCLICPYYIPKPQKHLCATEGSLFGPLRAFIGHFWDALWEIIGVFKVTILLSVFQS